MDTFEDFLRRGWIKAYGMSNWRLDRFVEAYEYCERMGYQGPSVYSPFFSLVKLESLGITVFRLLKRVAPFGLRNIKMS